MGRLTCLFGVDDDQREIIQGEDQCEDLLPLNSRSLHILLCEIRVLDICRVVAVSPWWSILPLLLVFSFHHFGEGRRATYLIIGRLRPKDGLNDVPPLRANHLAGEKSGGIDKVENEGKKLWHFFHIFFCKISFFQEFHFILHICLKPFSMLQPWPYQPPNIPPTHRT